MQILKTTGFPSVNAGQEGMPPEPFDCVGMMCFCGDYLEKLASIQLITKRIFVPNGSHEKGFHRFVAFCAWWNGGICKENGLAGRAGGL
jgi:hypothetical protein